MTELVFEFLRGPKKYLLRSKDKGPVNLPSDEDLRRLYLEATDPSDHAGTLDTIERFSEGCKLKFIGRVPGWLQVNFLRSVQRLLDSAV